MLARPGAQLQQHLAPGVQPGVPDQPLQQVGTVPAGFRHGRLGREHHGVRLVFAGVGRAAEERQGHLGHRRGVGADPFVHLAEPVRVLAGVGEDEVRAVAQQQSVGELFVHDADVTGDDDGPVGAVLPDPAQPVQHGLHTAPDEREDQHVVRLPRHDAQELGRGDLAQGVGAHAHLGQLARGGRGAAAQQEPVHDGRGGRGGGGGGDASGGRRPHFQRVSESARTAIRRLFVLLGGTVKTLESEIQRRANHKSTVS